MCLAPAAVMTMVEAAAADVLWPGHHHNHSPDDDDGRDDQRQQQPRCWPSKKQPCPCPQVDDDDDAARGGSNKVRRPAGSSSSPSASVAIIPVAAVTKRPSSSWAEDCYGDGEAAFVPPHVALEARRRRPEGSAALSMCEGRGRTLKGRDLQSVRNAVLRMTGFIET